MDVNIPLLKKALRYHGVSLIASRSYMSEAHLRRIAKGQSIAIRPSTRHLLAQAIGCPEKDLFPISYQQESMDAKEIQNKPDERPN